MWAMPKSATFTDAVRQQEDVSGLDVAMDDALPVRVVERIEDLRHDAHDVRGREALVRLEGLP